MEKIERFHFAITSLIRIILIVAASLAIYEKNIMVIFVILITFILTFLPDLIERKYKIDLPAEIEVIIVLFIFAAIFLGGPWDFYYKIWWWDSLLHFFSGIALGLAGFLILYVFYKKGKFKASPKTIMLFAFCFALSLGALWEIFEFSVDATLEYNMQKARNLETEESCNTWLGVRDTMIDLILDATGALIASILGYFYLKKGEKGILTLIIKRFERINPHLFKRNHKILN
jgi:hypothetical protein